MRRRAVPGNCCSRRAARSTDAGSSVPRPRRRPRRRRRRAMVIDWDADGRRTCCNADGSGVLVLPLHWGRSLEACQPAGMARLRASPDGVLDANGDGLHGLRSRRFRIALPCARCRRARPARVGDGRSRRRAEFEYATLARPDVHTVGRRIGLSRRRLRRVPHWSCRDSQDPTESAELSGSPMPTRARRCTHSVAGSSGLRGKAKRTAAAAP